MELTNEEAYPQEHESSGLLVMARGSGVRDSQDKEAAPQEVQREEDDPVQGVQRDEAPSKVRLTPGQLEQLKRDQFFERAKAFLANDPYWVHILVQERGKRKRLAHDFAKMITTIPKVQPNGPFNREVRRKIERVSDLRF